MKRVKLERVICVVALVLLAGLALAGCMNRTREQPVQVAPSPSYMPQGVTAQPGATQNNQGSFDWTAKAAQIENRINRISEIADARVVVTGNTALVGVRFDQAYRGDMTERIREMVAAEVIAADPKITTVAVTADDDDVEDIYEISDRTAAGREMDSLKDDINEIVRNATTLR